MKNISNQPLFIFTALALSALLWTACENSTSSEDEEHSDPFGVTLFLNGVEIATQENGEVTYHEGDHLEMKVGEETNLISIQWIADDGDRFVPDTEEGYSLQWIIGNENHLEVEQHEEDGPWSFHLVGLEAGETTVQFELWHNDHPDFTSSEFDVHIEEVVDGMEIQNEAGESITNIDSERNVTGEISVDAAATSGSHTVLFYDESGEAIDTSQGYELEWYVGDSNTASLNPVDGAPFSFTVTGNAAGQTNAHFELIKVDDQGGDEGHDQEGEIVVYESPDVTINVN
jgi:hypothetical protein